MFLFIVPECTAKHGTIGKRSLVLLVCTPDGYDVAGWRRLIRALLKLMLFYVSIGVTASLSEQLPETGAMGGALGAFPIYVSIFLLIALLSLGYLATAFLSKKRQCLHDMISGCAVHQRPSSAEQRKFFGLIWNA